MSDEPFHRLQTARRQAGYNSASDAAARLGVRYPTYAAHESGMRGFKLDQARKYAKAFKVSLSWLLTGSGDMERDGPDVVAVPVVGVIAAGMWLDADEHFAEDAYVPAVPDPRFPVAAQIAFQVKGPSMNKLIDDGAYAIGLKFDAARQVRDNDVVAVRRTRAGLVETTVKRFRVVDGVAALYPESTDPRHQTPVTIRSNEDDTTVEIFALIIGSYRPFM